MDRKSWWVAPTFRNRRIRVSMSGSLVHAGTCTATTVLSWLPMLKGGIVRSGLDRNMPPAIRVKPPSKTVSPILTTGSNGFFPMGLTRDALPHPGPLPEGEGVKASTPPDLPLQRGRNSKRQGLWIPAFAGMAEGKEGMTERGIMQTRLSQPRCRCRCFRCCLRRRRSRRVWPRPRPGRCLPCR